MAITRKVEGEFKNGEYVKYDPPLIVTTYAGRVLRVFKEDYRAMSDIYTFATFAEVLTESLTVQRVLVNANFECDTSEGHAVVDATPEVLSIKLLLDLEREKRELERQEKDRLAREEAERQRPVKGKKMRVVKGRKVPIGTVGVVAFIHENGGILLKDENHWRDRKAPGVWVNASNLQAV